MKYLDQYIIPISGLKEGEHWYEFKIEPQFFGFFDNADELAGTFEVKLHLLKRSTMMELEFFITGNINTLCDRCNNPLILPVTATDKIFVKFGQQEYEQTDEIIVLSEGEHELDLSHLLYELISLATPMKRVHEEGECNIEVIEKFKNIAVTKEDDKTDPRWDLLKNIKLD